LICGVIVIFSLIVVLNRPKESDSAQIVDALNASIQASKDGKAGGVLDKLSSAFEVNNARIPSDKIVAFVKRLRPDISVDDPKPILKGDDAEIISTVHVEGTFMGLHPSADLKGVIINFHRETTYKWLIVPEATWHMTSIQLSPDGLSDVEQWSSFLD
jgi:hypothetical protein